MEELSPRQKQILDFISEFFEDKGYAPSVRDVSRGCGISVCASVAQYHLNVLERKGYIHRDRDVSRSIGLTRKATAIVKVLVLATIAAGQPIPVPSADTWTATPEETLEAPQ